jgi:formylglycine-generating enzyme required for sulfatase activity
MPAWFVYVVRCRDGSLYTGISRDVAARVHKHNQGKGARYTRGRGPVHVIHTELRRTKGAALRREAAIKALPRVQKLALCLAVAVFMLIPSGGDGQAAPAAAKARDRVAIPAGPFTRGSARGADDERPVRVHKLDAYRIDRTEVTRAMYAACVAARRCSPVGTDLLREPNLPMTNVNWHEARAFCTYAGGRLPTEDEWEKAARGHDTREYPWGDTLDCAHANWGNFENEGPCAGKNPGKPSPVGSYPDGASPFGVLDMAGNVWEWVAEKYDRDPSRRVVRGGSCCTYFVVPRLSNRNAWDPAYRDGDLGFRCVSR